MPGAPKRLRCEYLENPIGIDEVSPRLSWWLDDERPAEIQTAYHILAARRAESLSEDVGDLWDSGRVESAATTQIVYAGEGLESRQRVWWKVRAFDSDGIGSPWSRIAFFETGLLEPGDWRGRWIAAPLMGGKRTPVQVPALRRAFELPQPVQSARLYISALGVYDVELNGIRAIDIELAPGWTDFRKRVRYQSFDVTRFLRQGENVIGVLLGDGWYCGTLGCSDRQQYGERPALLAQLDIKLDDGTPLRFVTDELWKWQRSAILYSDVMTGESVDGRQRLGAWSSAGYDLAGWAPVDVLARLDVQLNASMSPPVRVIDRIDPVGQPVSRMTAQGTRRLIYDLGQNIVGRVRLRLRAARGTLIQLRYAERLDDAGEIYTASLRRAAAMDLYTCSGAADGEVFEPRFTWHGFQFVEISGEFGVDAVEELCGVVLGSALPQIGEFQCDHPLLDRLQQNIAWSQRGSLLEIPTSSPQRDERLGATGDAQAFVRSAAFNMDVTAFFGKWLVDLTDAQHEDGTIPPVAPLPPALTSLPRDGGPAWSDAIVICPWTVYRCCGDRRVLERHFSAMQAFVDNIETRYPDLIRADAQVDPWQGYGDWLAVDGIGSTSVEAGTTPRDLIGTAFFCYSAKLLARIAGVLGNVSELERYEDLAQRVRAAFRRRFVTSDGRLVGETQTAYVLALYFGMLDRGEIDGAFTALVRDIEARGMKLSTGGAGTPYLLHVLTSNDRLDLAYRLLLDTSPPGWLYAVTQGATTIWERWDSWTEHDGFADPARNGFNHTTHGAVGEWLYGTVAGLELDPDLAPARNAYRRARIQPRPPRMEDFPDGLPIRFVKAALDTVHGRYEVSWEISAGHFVLKVQVPPNCSAMVILPDGEQHDVVAGRHQYTVTLDADADDGIPLLSAVTDIAS